MTDSIKEFFTSTPLIELLLIWFAKSIEVSMGTTRHILVNKGYRKQGALIAFFEIILWVFVASTVINGMQTAPIKGIFYSAGYATGVFLGSTIEKRLAFGKILLQTITAKDKADILAETLRSEGFGVTVIEAEGREEERALLLVFANRKGHGVLFELIKAVDPDAMIVTNEVSTLEGGYLSNWNRIAK